MKKVILCLMLVATCSGSIEDFMKEHITKGSHKDETVPEVIRGENFTKENVKKYFDSPIEMGSIRSSKERVLRSIGPEEIITVGKEAWAFVKENKPVVNINSDYTGAIPASVSDWRKLSGWKNAMKGPYYIRWINGFNHETVSIDFKWSSSYGGSYGNTGHYVTQAGPVVGAVDVSWGYNVDVDVKAFDPLNVGTETDPVGQIDVEITSRMSNVLNDQTNNCRVRFVGNGDIKNVHCNLR